MTGLSYVIGKLAFEEAFIIILLYYLDSELFYRDNWFPNMSPFVGTPITPLDFAKIKGASIRFL